MRKIIYFLIPVFTFLALYSFWGFFGPYGNSQKIQVFVVPQNSADFNISKTLEDQKLIRNASFFQFLLNNFSGGFSVKPGGYKLSNNMNAWQVMKKITGNLDLVWFTESYCVRREQLGEYLSESLNWDGNKLDTWNSYYKNISQDYFEGVYYPDTYLIPLDESPDQVAQRFINNHLLPQIQYLLTKYKSQ